MGPAPYDSSNKSFQNPLSVSLTCFMSRHMELVLKIKNQNGFLQLRFHKEKNASLIKIYGSQ